MAVNRYFDQVISVGSHQQKVAGVYPAKVINVDEIALGTMLKPRTLGL